MTYDSRKQDVWPAGKNKQTPNNPISAKNQNDHVQPAARGKGNLIGDKGKDDVGTQPQAPSPQKPKP